MSFIPESIWTRHDSDCLTEYLLGPQLVQLESLSSFSLTLRCSSVPDLLKEPKTELLISADTKLVPQHWVSSILAGCWQSLGGSLLFGFTLVPPGISWTSRDVRLFRCPKTLLDSGSALWPGDSSCLRSAFFLFLVFMTLFSAFSLYSATSALEMLSCFFHLVLLFWNQILTWKWTKITCRLTWNLYSNSSQTK